MKKPGNARSYQFGACTLALQFGDITSAEAEVIVSSDDYLISMGGGVSAAILEAGGQEIMIDAEKKTPARLGDVVITTAGRLTAKYVFHAITIAPGPENTTGRGVVKSAVSRCFDLLDALGLRSIAFPAIGAGVAGFPHEDVAVQMAQTITERLARSTRPLEVRLFLFDRFGRMQPIDYVQFFEEFARRMPSLQSAEDRVLPASKPPQAAPKGDSADPRVRLRELTEERTRIEDGLARIGDTGEKAMRLRSDLDRISEERIRLLACLQRSTAAPVSVFISYSHSDQDFRDELEKQLIILQRQNVIDVWHDRKIAPGSEWKGIIDERLRSSRVILLLVSPDFMASTYCYDIEMTESLRRHDAQEATVIPIILRSVMWDNAPFARIQALPRDGKPVKTWADRDGAMENVARGIRAVIESIVKKSATQSA